MYDQPYLFFHEQTFRKRLHDRAIPDYLIFSLLATALRFARDPYFQGKEIEAAASYASSSWRLMASCWTGDHGGFDMDGMFALTFLSLHDVTGMYDYGFLSFLPLLFCV